jgi:hypothetical protein
VAPELLYLKVQGQMKNPPMAAPTILRCEDLVFAQSLTPLPVRDSAAEVVRALVLTLALTAVACGTDALTRGAGTGGQGGKADTGGMSGRGSMDGSVPNSGGTGGGTAGDAGYRDSSATACSQSLTPGATMDWLDDGTPECAVDVGATLMTSPGSEILQLLGAEVMTVSIEFTVTGPPSLQGPFFCEPTTTAASFTYSSNSVGYTVESCTVTITSVGAPEGANAVGTFSAVLRTPSGTMKTISDGHFDAPVVAIGG